MKFTIAIPAYKALFLKESIESVLSQTYSDFELIIVNDASPYNVDIIVNQYDSPHIRYYINPSNFGALNVVDNWNICLQYAKGDFFVLLGDDDILHSDYLSEFSLLFDKYPNCDVYNCRTIIINEESIPIGITEPRPEIESVYDAILQRMKGNRHSFISDNVFRTKKLKLNGGFYKLPLAWASDDISCFIAARENGIAHTEKPIFMYRQSAATISSSGNIYHKLDAINGEEKWLSELIKDNPRNGFDLLLLQEIKSELKFYIHKKKILTIFSDKNYRPFSFFKWLLAKRKYGLTFGGLFYGLITRVKEKQRSL